jgi:RNA polymerase sigma-70 factor (ECF subfamily)
VQAENLDLIARFLEEESAAVRTVDRWIARFASPYRRRLGTGWEDALQDIRLELVQLLRNGQFRGESALSTYLWRVVGHYCINRIRAEVKWQWSEVDDIAAFLEDKATSPLDSLLRKESDQRLLRVLEEAPEDCRKLWRMVLEGRSYQEISGVLGVAEGTLRVRMLRCRQKAVASREAMNRKSLGRM